jgi:phage tail-like protein
VSCVDAAPTFRLLDARVGWDVAETQGLDGFDDPSGLRLAGAGIDPAALLAHLPPPRLARGGRPRSWWLVTDDRPSRLLRRGPCSEGWEPAWPPGCDPGLLVEAVAVAARGRRLAVADRGAGRVWVWTAGGGRLAAAIPVADPVAVAFTPWGELLVATADRLLRFGPGGELRGEVPLPEGRRAERLAAGRGCSIWLVGRDVNGALDLWRATRHDPVFRPAPVADLTASLPRGGVAAVSAVGFCLTETTSGNVPVARCFTWRGCALQEREVEPADPPVFETLGQLLTLPIDSGIARCRWHRARIDADLPPGTSVELKVASGETPDPPDQGDADREGVWKSFPAGLPHPDDWQRSPGAVDVLFRQPPGRYLFLCLRLTGDGRATPVVRRVRLDFPRVTSLELLPSVYRDDPRAEDFTERFLSLFDAAVEDLDALIDRFPVLLDGAGVDERVLPWLGSLLDVAFEPSWPAERRRAILQALPELYRLRGTPEGIARAVELVFGARPAIQELARERRWGAVGRDGRLGAVRLFGRARSRFRLGASALSAAPLVSYGDPDLDPLAAGAHRFRVLMPPGTASSPEARARLERLVESQKPAHTLAAIRVGGRGFVLGPGTAVGVDTVFGPLPAPVLGAAGNVRLGRASVLWAGPRGPRTGFTVGAAAVGMQTSME